MKTSSASAALLAVILTVGSSASALAGVTLAPSGGLEKEISGGSDAPPVEVKPGKKTQPTLPQGGGDAPAPPKVQMKPAGTPKPSLMCRGKEATIVASPQGGKTSGTSGDDVIVGLGGPDIIEGLGGNDIICGGGGNDTLRGGNGADKIEGGPGNDTIYGEGGHDILKGGDGADRIYGGAGDDELYGENGGDILDGGSGNDILDGGAGLDSCSNPGNYFEKTTGCENFGGSTSPGPQFTLPAKTVPQETGFGSKVVARPGGVQVLPSQVETGEDAGDPEMVPGKLEFGKGLGKIKPPPPPDREIGKAPEGAHLPQPHLEIGEDAGSPEAQLPGRRLEKVREVAFTCGGKVATIVVGAERVQSLQTDSDSARSVKMGSQPTKYFGTEGDDVIVGSPGRDHIYGFGGNDVICGGGDRDYLWGGRGDDQIYGGPGMDWIHGEEGNDVLYGNEGDDTLIGDEGNDTLYGGGGDDSLNGFAGDDNLYGESGNDSLKGQEGNDFLFGDNGNDTLDGGPGDDILDGGAGKDLCNPGPAGPGRALMRAPVNCEEPEVSLPFIREVEVLPYSTYAKFLVTVWQSGSAELRLHSTPLPKGRECDPTLEAAHVVESERVNGGTWFKLVSGLAPGRPYTWEVCGIPDKYSDTISRKEGVFRTLERRVTIAIEKVEVVDDSDELSAGEFQFSFFIGVDETGNCKFDMQASYPQASVSEVMCDSGETITFNPPVRLSTLVPKEGSVKLTVAGRDVDDDPHAFPYYACPATRDGLQCNMDMSGDDQASIVRTFNLRPQGPTAETIQEQFQMEAHCSKWYGRLWLRYHGSLWVDYVNAP
jgi:hypothetical protein